MWDIFQYIGVLGPYILIGFSCMYLWTNQQIIHLQYFGAGAAFNMFINLIIKTLVQQPRPKEDLTIGDNKYEFGLTDEGKRSGKDRFGMPSGHAQTSAYCLAFMAPIFSAVSASVSSHFPFSYFFFVYLAIATGTVIQRIVYKHHTFAQIGVGLVLGAIIGTATYRLAKRTIKGVLQKKEDDWRFNT